MGGAVITAVIGSSLCFPPLALAVIPVSIFSMAGADIGCNKLRDYMHWYGFSNINSILLNTDFHGTKIEDVYFSNLKFGNCLNISTSKSFIGCLFENVVSSDRRDIERFKNKGAKTDNETRPDGQNPLSDYEKYNTNFNFIWAKTKYQSYMKQLSKEIYSPDGWLIECGDKTYHVPEWLYKEAE